jgi:hypothetical protein
MSPANPARRAGGTEVACVSVSDAWSTTRLVAEDPEFVLAVGNLTTPVGREAVLSCTVDRLGKYKVSKHQRSDNFDASVTCEVTVPSCIHMSSNKSATKEQRFVTEQWQSNLTIIYKRLYIHQWYCVPTGGSSMFVSLN